MNKKLSINTDNEMISNLLFQFAFIETAGDFIETTPASGIHNFEISKFFSFVPVRQRCCLTVDADRSSEWLIIF